MTSRLGLLILTAVLIQMGLCARFIVSHDLNPIVFLYHGIIGGAVLTSTLAVLIVTCHIALIRRIILGYVVAGIVTIYILFTALIWALTLIGKHYVGTIIPIYFIPAQYQNIGPVLANLGISTTSFWLSLWLFVLILYIVVYRFTPAIIRDLDALIAILRKQLSRPWPSRIQLGFVLPLLTVSGSAVYSISSYDKIFWTLHTKEEPISTVLFGGSFQGLKISTKKVSDFDQTILPSDLEFERKNIILIMADALRAENMSVYGYERETTPFLDSLDRMGHLKRPRLSFAMSSNSFIGILSTLRSRAWTDMTLSDYGIHDALFHLGYQVNFLLSGDHEGFFGIKNFYGKNISRFADGHNNTNRASGDDELIFDHLSTMDDYDGTPAFFYFHLMSVHNMGVLLPQFDIHQPSVHRYVDEEAYTNRYDNRIIQLDWYVHRLMDTLDVMGYLDNSIVIFTADHGESLGEKGLMGHTSSLYNEQVVIPLIFYDPSNDLDSLNSIGFQIDIAPTVFDILGIPKMDSWEGHSLLEDQHLTEREEILEDPGRLGLLKIDDMQMIKYIVDKNTNTEEIYFLHEDWNETTNEIRNIDSRALARFRDRLQQPH